MGQRGPAPKPTRLAELQGNPGKRALNRKEAHPDQGPMPQCPKWLEGAGRAEWHRVARQLYNVGLLTRVDLAVLAMYCQAYGRMVEAEGELKRQPEVIESDKGNLYQNPWYGVARTAARDALRYAQELGMTPAARTRISVEKPEAESLADALFGDVG